MNLKSLKVFTFIMEEGSLAQASARLNLSASAASRLLALLEEEFDIRLFRRDKKRLVPTAEAEQFYPEALRILSQIDHIPNLVEQIKSQSAPPMRIICHSRVVNGLVLPAMKRLADQQPDLRMVLDIYPRRDLTRRTMDGLFDICVSALPLPIQGIKPHVLASTHLHVALPRDHPLAARAQVSLSDLAHERYIALEHSTVLRRVVEQELARHGTSLPIAYEVSASAAAHELVRMGLGFTFADPFALDPAMSDAVALVPFSLNVRIEYGCFTMHPDAPSGAAVAFQDILTTLCKQKTGRAH